MLREITRERHTIRTQNSQRRMDDKIVTHTDRITDSALNYNTSILDETKIRSKVIAELHVKRIEVSINCSWENSDVISSNSLAL